MYLNGELICSKALTAMTLSKDGVYKIVVTDTAGHITEYTFEKLYSLNGWSVLLIVLFILGLGGVGFLVYKIRTNKKVR